jgi:hypothetical protein
LICTVTERGGEGDVALELSGPFALFRKTRLYGRALGEIIPMLSWCSRFRLQAECVLHGRRLTLELRAGDPVFPGGAPRLHDSRIEERFAREFRKLAPEWDVVREPEPINAGGTLIFPDFALQCRANPDVLWAQHHNGIFRSVDGASSWSEIENVAPSSFGFAVAVHPSHADTAWFVPGVSDEKRHAVEGRVIVNRTGDGGRTFEPLTRGLPQQHAYDLVLRHALDVDETGDRLAFGSTTGSLWVSDDGGETWQTISSNLPPIYAVRFEH